MANDTTYGTNSEIRDRAVLVSLTLKGEDRELADYSMEELISLAETAGVDVLQTMSQSKESADSRWLIGKGKLAELKELVLEHAATTVVFDRDLSGAQVRNLEAELDAKIIDRTQLILDIFAQRAKTREGIIQVELAQLSYLLPRLAGHGKNLSRLGGGIGTRGPGETKLETDRRHIRNRIAELKRQLSEVVRHRKLHRERRRKTGVVQVALVGYTNAGKSTLLRQLTGADVLAENRLFATLDPTSRSLRLPGGKEIVLTDTVGFIQNLPHDLVAAFRATLEEVNEADLILHVVDGSSSMKEEHIRVVSEVLEELGAHLKDQLLVYNKMDLVEQELAPFASDRDGVLHISAFSAEDLQKLLEAIENHLMGERITYRIPAERGDLAAQMYRVGEVLGQRADGEHLWFNVRVDKQQFAEKGHMLAPFITAESGPAGEDFAE